MIGKFTKKDRHYTPSLEKRILGFDELRGGAVLLVLIAHWGLIVPIMTAFNAGPVGVDIFFVISGFLIGKILTKHRGSAGYYRTFYIRRIFRILPLAFAIIALGAVANLVMGRGLESLVYYLTFTQNYIPVFAAENLGKPVDVLPLVGTSPMWSLAVEEQIYIFLPLLVGIIPQKFIGLSMLIVSIVGVLFSLNAMANFAEPDVWYTNYRETWNRMHYIAIGVLISLKEKRLVLYLPVIILAIGVILVAKPLLLAQAAIFAVIIYVVSHLRDGKAFINSKLLSWCGVRCFGIYLIHYPIIAALKELSKKGFINSDIRYVGAFLFYTAGTSFLAWVSFKYFEMPIQKLRTRFER